MCKVLNVSRSGYYPWTRRPESERKKRRRELEQQISRIFVDSRRLYGSPKITQVLRRQGVRVSEKTVARIMKELGLVEVSRTGIAAIGRGPLGMTARPQT